MDSSDDDEPDFVGDLLPLDTSDLDALDRELESDYVTISKAWYAATGGQVGEQDKDEVVEPEDLPVDELSLAAGGSKKTAGKDSKKKVKSKKPAFYDVAFNYVAGFDLDAIARKAGLQGAVAEDEPVKAANAKSQSAPAAMEVEEEEEEEQEESDEEEEEAVPVQEAPKKGGWGFGLFGRR